MTRFSDRTSFDFSENRLTRLARRLREEGETILDLTLSNPTRAGFEYPRSRILAGLSREAGMVYQPVPEGLAEARRVVADYYRARGVESSIRNLFLTAGSSEAYSFLFKLLADPGETILAPIPSYPLFPFLARLESVSLVAYRLHYGDRWFVDLEMLRDLARRHDPRAILVVHPNNPTGSFLKPKEWTAVQEIAEEVGSAVICDEVFVDYSLGRSGTPPVLESSGGLSFFLNGLSKTALLPQLKLGWIRVEGTVKAVAECRKRLELIGDTFLSVSTPAQLALSEILKEISSVQGQVFARGRRNLAVLRTLCSGTSLTPLHVEAGWSAILRVPRVQADEEWALRLLQEEKVLVHPGHLFEFEEEGHLVVSLLPPEEEFRRGVQRLVDLVSGR